MDEASIVSALTTVGVAMSQKDVILKLVGPTADYLGLGAAGFVKRSSENIGRILGAMARRLGGRIEEPGGLPPRVVGGLLTAGAFCEDPLAVEYFGGVLASSRTGMARDDRGATFIALVSRLSVYQLRSHYAFYRMIRHVLPGHKSWPGRGEDRGKLAVFMPLAVYKEVLDLHGDEEVQQFTQLVNHVTFGLLAEGLIEAFELGGEKLAARAKVAMPRHGCLSVTPSALGVELFMWAHGKGLAEPVEFFDPAVEFVSPEQPVTIPEGFHLVHRPGPVPVAPTT